MARQQITFRFRAGQRVVTVKAFDAVGPEDCYDIGIAAVLHRFVTSEDLLMPVPRDVKDFMIRLNLSI